PRRRGAGRHRDRRRQARARRARRRARPRAARRARPLAGRARDGGPLLRARARGRGGRASRPRARHRRGAYRTRPARRAAARGDDRPADSAVRRRRRESRPMTLHSLTRRPLLLVALAALLLAAPTASGQGARTGERKKPAAAAKAAPEKKGARSAASSWYALRVTRGDTGVIVTSLWSSGRNLRAEAVLSGVPIQQLVDGEWYYVIDGMRHTGMAVRRSPKALEQDLARPARRPFGNEGADLEARGAELVREEELGGRKAKVLRLTDAMGRHEVWVTDDESALPIRIDSTDRRDRKSTRLNSSHVKISYAVF